MLAIEALREFPILGEYALAFEDAMHPVHSARGVLTPSRSDVEGHNLSGADTALGIYLPKYGAPIGGGGDIVVLPNKLRILRAKTSFEPLHMARWCGARRHLVEDIIGDGTQGLGLGR
jgi:hypothetical protein